MNQPTRNHSPLQSDSPARLYLVVVGIAMACGLAIASTYQLTRQRSVRNQTAARHEAVKQVLPGTVSSETFQYRDGDGFFVSDDRSSTDDIFIAGYDRSGKLIGIAIEAVGYGYQDSIRLIYGYDPDRQVITGFQVLESRETPGLGDRVESDESFLAKFSDLSVALDSTGTSIANPIVFIAQRTPEEPWQVDGVTGATITSGAIVSILSSSASKWVPKIQAGIHDRLSPLARQGREQHDAR